MREKVFSIFDSAYLSKEREEEERDFAEERVLEEEIAAGSDPKRNIGVCSPTEPRAFSRIITPPPSTSPPFVFLRRLR